MGKTMRISGVGYDFTVPAVTCEHCNGVGLFSRDRTYRLIDKLDGNEVFDVTAKAGQPCWFCCGRGKIAVLDKF